MSEEFENTVGRKAVNGLQSTMDVTFFHGRPGSSVYARPEMVGVCVILAIGIFFVGLFLLVSMFSSRPKKVRMEGEKRKLMPSWIGVLQGTGVMYLVALVLQGARWGVMIGELMVGKEWRAFEPLIDAFVGGVEVGLLGVMVWVVGVGLDGLVKKDGTDGGWRTRLKSLWAGAVLKGLWGCVLGVTIVQVGLGFAIMKEAFDGYKWIGANKEGPVHDLWRLGDRSVGTQLREVAAEAKALAGTLKGSPEFVWNTLMLRFTEQMEQGALWMDLRKAQIGVEIARNVLIMAMLLVFAIVAFIKRNISNDDEKKNSKGFNRPRSIVRQFLFWGFPFLLLTTTFNLGISIYLDLHNFEVITNQMEWSYLRLRNSAFFNSDNADGLFGFLMAYHTVFTGFPVLSALVKNIGWVLIFVMLCVLSKQSQGAAKRKIEAEAQAKEEELANVPYAELSRAEESQPKPKKKNVSLWKWGLF